MSHVHRTSYHPTPSTQYLHSHHPTPLRSTCMAITLPSTQYERCTQYLSCYAPTRSDVPGLGRGVA
eukprot:1579676-Rhodomonas_salina.1